MSRRPPLALLVALVAVAGCGGDDEPRAGCVELRDAATTVVADAPGATGGQLVRTRQRICERARRAEMAVDVDVREEGLTAHAREADPDALRALLARGRLAIVDWEQNAYGGPRADLRAALRAARRARPRAEEADVPPGGRSPAALAAADVEPGDERALRRFHDRRNDVATPARWLFDARRRLVAGPVEPGTEPPPGGEALDVPRGVRVVEAEGGGWVVVEDDAELVGADLEDPRADADVLGDGPVVVAELRADGRRRFEALTRRVARRGARAGEPQRFAILLDARVLALASVDHRTDPGGMTGESGIQLGPVGSLAATEALAAALALGPLPVALALR